MLLVVSICLFFRKSLHRRVFLDLRYIASRERYVLVHDSLYLGALIYSISKSLSLSAAQIELYRPTSLLTQLSRQIPTSVIAI